jgi:uncharacterized protein involved in outer membrane biogenesis
MVRRAAKWLLCFGLGAAALLVLAVISLPLWVRPLVARQAAAMLGRAVTIGRVELHPGAPVTLVARDIVIGNPDGFAADQEAFARIPGLTVRIDVAASLRHHAVVIGSVEIDRPVIHVVRTEDGRANYHLPSPFGAPIRSLSIRNGRAHVFLAH